MMGQQRRTESLLATDQAAQGTITTLVERRWAVLSSSGSPKPKAVGEASRSKAITSHHPWMFRERPVFWWFKSWERLKWRRSAFPPQKYLLPL